MRTHLGDSTERKRTANGMGAVPWAFAPDTPAEAGVQPELHSAWIPSSQAVFP